MEDLPSSIHQLIFIADSVPVHLNYLDANEKFVFVNKAAAEFWGLAPQEMLGRSIKEMVGEDGYEDIKEFIARVLNGERVSHEAPFSREGKTPGYFFNTYIPDFDSTGKVIGFAATGTDISFKKEAEREVEQALEELKAEQAMREQFAASLSHDLRTPLAAAKMSAQLLVRKADKFSEIHKMSGRVIDNLQRADGMIQDLLDASRIKAGEKLSLDKKEVNLTELVKTVLKELETIHGERFEYKASDEISGEVGISAIRRIVENLCSNAIKYGSKDHPVTVTLSSEMKTIILKVHNSGTPIPLDELKYLFQPFSRAPSAVSSQEKGWGLGLTLVQGLVEAHGGKVEVESSHTNGTTFTVKLPLIKFS